MRRKAAILVALMAAPVGAQSVDEDYRIQGEHPRLLLTARRVRLLRRERERESIRWQQFQLLMAGKARMPEPGFALALYSQVTTDPAPCREATAWALGRARDLRQVALVFDWCHDQLAPADARTIASRLLDALRAPFAEDVPAVRSRVFAAIAAADEAPRESEHELERVVRQWWRQRIVPELQAGRSPIRRSDVYALAELLHAIRDNLNIDLRESAAFWFKDLGAYQMLGYYPAPFPAPENEYRVPIYAGGGDPDLREAALSRAANFALVAYDTNATSSQFLQGWLIHDRFLLRGAFGAVYEFFWANPYQPGLSYYHMPLHFHDPRSGRLFLRSSWEDDAIWFGCFDGQVQMFRDGRVTTLKSGFAPLQIGAATVISGSSPMRYTREEREAETVYIMGQKPHARYDVEVDDEEMREVETDGAGTLALEFGKESKARFRLKASP